MSSSYEDTMVDPWESLADGMAADQISLLNGVKQAFGLFTEHHVGEARTLLGMTPAARFDEYLRQANPLNRSLLQFYMQLPIKQRKTACTKFLEAQSGVVTVSEGRPIDFDKIKADLSLKAKFAAHLQQHLDNHLRNLAGIGFPVEKHVSKPAN